MSVHGIQSDGETMKQWLMCFLACLLVLPARADESRVAGLFQRFLTQTNTSGLVVFQREVALPVRPAAARSADGRFQSDSGRTNYYSFFWNGTNFLMAQSSEKPVTNETALASAKKICGYDGKFYWRLINDAVQTYTKPTNGAAADLVDSADMLTVVPQEEAEHADPRVDRVMPALLELAAECRRVVQMGFTFPMAGPPVRVSSNTFTARGIDGMEQTAQMTGDPDRPET